MFPIKFQVNGQLFASTYGSASYGSNAYGSTTTTGSTTKSTTNTTHSVLVDTGVALVGFITIAAIIIFVTLVIKFWVKPGRTKKSKKD